MKKLRNIICILLCGIVLTSCGNSNTAETEEVVPSSSEMIESSSQTSNKTIESTEPSSSEPSEPSEKNNNDTNNSEVEASIKKVDAKYDEMIKKAQGYVDNPTSYNDTAALEFLADYMELMTEYNELGEAIDNAGDNFSSSDSMKVYTNMLIKYTKLMELQSKLS